MNKYKILILEDDVLYGMKLEIMLEDSDYEVVKICTNIQQINEALKTERFDLLICDLIIDGKYHGIELIKSLKQHSFPIIGITASNEESIYEEIIDMVYGYIVKPFHKITLMATIKKSLDDFSEKRLHDFISQKYIFVSGKGGKQEKLNFSDILYLESAVNYSMIHTTRAKYAKKVSLKKMVEQELDDRFLRIHHRFAVNSEYIINKNLHEIELINGQKFTISRSFSDETKAFFGKKKSVPTRHFLS
jgi:DNA-binding LytR/AlgR family response regulator